MTNHKWIVHPFSYGERGHREISVIHESNTHGLRSYGGFNVDKKLIAQETMYGNMDEGAYELSIKYAEDMANQLNIDNVQPNEALLKHTKQQDEYSKEIGKWFRKREDEAVVRSMQGSF